VNLRQVGPGDWVAVYTHDGDPSQPRLRAIGCVARVVEPLPDPFGYPVTAHGWRHICLEPHAGAVDSTICECFGTCIVIPLRERHARAALRHEDAGVRELALRALVTLREQE